MNEFQASTLLKESLARSLLIGSDPKKDYIHFHGDPHFNNPPWLMT